MTINACVYPVAKGGVCAAQDSVRQVLVFVPTIMQFSLADMCRPHRETYEKFLTLLGVEGEPIPWPRNPFVEGPGDSLALAEAMRLVAREFGYERMPRIGKIPHEAVSWFQELDLAEVRLLLSRNPHIEELFLRVPIDPDEIHPGG